MEVLASMVLKFVKKFLLKYLGTQVIEKLVVEILGILVKKTDSKFDDKIYEIVFKKIK